VFESFAFRESTFLIKSAWKAIWTETHNRAAGWLSNQAKPYGRKPRDLVTTRCCLADMVAWFLSRSHDAVIGAYDESGKVL
jgi:hypothetical protein